MPTNINNRIVNNSQLEAQAAVSSASENPLTLQNTVKLSGNAQDAFDVGTRVSLPGGNAVNINDHIGFGGGGSGDLSSLSSAAMGTDITIETTIHIGSQPLQTLGQSVSSLSAGQNGGTGAAITKTSTASSAPGASQIGSGQGAVLPSVSSGTGHTATMVNGSTGSFTSGSSSTGSDVNSSTASMTGTGAATTHTSPAAATSTAAALLLADDKNHAGTASVLADASAGYSAYKSAGGTDDATTWRNKDLPAANVNASSVLSAAIAAGPTQLQVTGDASLQHSLNSLGVSTGSVASASTSSVTSTSTSSVTTTSTSTAQNAAAVTQTAAALITQDDQNHLGEDKVLSDAAAEYKNYKAAGGTDDAATWRNKDLPASIPNVGNNAAFILNSAVAVGPSWLQVTNDASLKANLNTLGVSTGTAAE